LAFSHRSSYFFIRRPRAFLGLIGETFYIIRDGKREGYIFGTLVVELARLELAERARVFFVSFVLLA
jgi:hypothetical protein